MRDIEEEDFRGLKITKVGLFCLREKKLKKVL